MRSLRFAFRYPKTSNYFPNLAYTEYIYIYIA